MEAAKNIVSHRFYFDWSWASSSSRQLFLPWVNTWRKTKTMDHSENVNNQARRASLSSLLVTRIVPLMLVLQILLTLLIYPFLPNTIPSHWNETGPTASYEAKWIYVGFMPIFSILLYLFVLGLLLTFVVNNKPNSRDMSAKKNEISRSLLIFMMMMQQSLFFITQVVLLIVSLRVGSGAIH
jgi:uncharacterized membrane protein